MKKELALDISGEHQDIMDAWYVQKLQSLLIPKIYFFYEIVYGPFRRLRHIQL